MARSSKRFKAPKMPFSLRKHLLPPLIGISVMAGVFVLLNAQWLAARYTYHFRPPASIVIPSVSAAEKAENQTPTLMIPNIGVKVPVVFETSTADAKVQLALHQGVVHYGSTAEPGLTGNSVIFGHSSGLPWAAGDYKYVFTLLDKVHTSDVILLDYQGVRYTYKVTSTEVIMPTNLSVLNQHTSKPVLTLITCTPAGSNKYRLVVHADQISPKVQVSATPVKPAGNRLPAQLPK